MFIPYERPLSLQFSEKKNGWWGRLLLPEILGQWAPVGVKIANFEPIFARTSASVVTPSEKKLN